MKLSFAKKAAAAGIAFSFFLTMPVQAYWQNEAAGPGLAVWVEDAPGAETDDISQSPGTPDSSDEAPSPSENTPSGDAVTAETQTPSGDAITEHPDGSVPNGTESTVPETVPDGTSPIAIPADSLPDSSQEASQSGSIVMSNGRQIDLSKPMIALTYDDGPQSSVGNRIMDIAEQYNGRVTFFMVGERVRSHATEVKRMVTDGHEVANHTYNHKYLNKVSAAEVQSQVQKCSDVIEEVSGVRPTLMRLPGGNKNQTVLQNVNMPIILWNIDTLDWKTRNAQKTVNAVVGKVKDGDIVLMHELYSATGDATATIIPALAAQGFQFVTVSELAGFKGKSLSAGQVYYSIR